MATENLKTQITDKGLEYAKFLHTVLPEGRDRAVVLNTLEAAMHVAVGAVEQVA